MSLAIGRRAASNAHAISRLSGPRGRRICQGCSFQRSRASLVSCMPWTSTKSSTLTDQASASAGPIEYILIRAMSEAVLAIAGERSVETVLQRIVHAARERPAPATRRSGARRRGTFAHFITSGMTEEEIAAMGPLPRTHGLLGATLESPASYRTTTSSATRASAVVAFGPPADGVVPGRADRGARRGGGRVLPDRQGGRRRVQCRRSGADRAARRRTPRWRWRTRASTSAAASCRSSRSATGWRASCTTRWCRSCSAWCWRRSRPAR